MPTLVLTPFALLLFLHLSATISGCSHQGLPTNPDGEQSAATSPEDQSETEPEAPEDEAEDIIESEPSDEQTDSDNSESNPDDTSSPDPSTEDNPSQSGTCEGHYLIASAEELSILENCKSITGTLTLNGVVIEHLDLTGLQSIGGSLFIHETDGLADLAGFSGLESIGEHLKITNNIGLISLDGLEKLRTISDELYITGNPDLLEVDALSLVKDVQGRMMHVSSNPSLQSLSGFESLRSVGGTLTIWNNNQLTNLDGLHNLTFIGESDDEERSLDISYNQSLLEVDALTTIEKVYGSLRLVENGDLVSIEGLNGLTRVGEDFVVTNNWMLSTCAAEGLQQQLSANGGIGGETIISGNNAELPCD